MGDTAWMPQLSAAKCNGCGACIAQCPTGALGWLHGKAALLDAERCIYCATCEAICPTDAIALPYLVLKAADSEEGE